LFRSSVRVVTPCPAVVVMFNGTRPGTMAPLVFAHPSLRGRCLAGPWVPPTAGGGDYEENKEAQDKRIRGGLKNNSRCIPLRGDYKAKGFSFFSAIFWIWKLYLITPPHCPRSDFHPHASRRFQCKDTISCWPSGIYNSQGPGARLNAAFFTGCLG